MYLHIIYERNRRLRLNQQFFDSRNPRTLFQAPPRSPAQVSLPPSTMAAFTAPTPVNFATIAEADASPVQLQLRALEQTAGLYTEDAVAALEAYLAEQLAGASVDADANLALLKLYLIFPERADAAKVAAVLLKGVQVTPSPFFTGATTLVPESLREVRPSVCCMRRAPLSSPFRASNSHACLSL